MRRGGKALVLAAVLAAGGEARAQEEEGPPVERAAGTYQGVAPDERPPRPAAERHRRAGGAPRVTWLGFQPRPDGGARVFVQLDREVQHAERVQDGALVVSLEGARAARPNARRFLDTRFFDTPVERVALEGARGRPGARRRGLELTIRFKSAADARPIAAESSRGRDGFTYLVVDVPRAAAPE